MPADAKLATPVADRASAGRTVVMPADAKLVVPAADRASTGKTMTAYLRILVTHHYLPLFTLLSISRPVECNHIYALCTLICESVIACKGLGPKV